MRLPKLRFGDMIKIIWVDIVSNNKWNSKEEVLNSKTASCIYVGMFVSKDSECMRCCNTLFLEEGDMDYMIFPLGVIKSISILKEVNNVGC